MKIILIFNFYFYFWKTNPGMTSKQLKYQRQITNPAIYFFFMLWRLPSLVFWGVKVKELSLKQSQITMKHSWKNQNPFGSIYFSALNGAAELSTGILVQLSLQDKEPYSMLVVESKSQFYKKAVGKIYFKCEDGDKLQAILPTLSDSRNTATITLKSSAINEEHILVGEFYFTWSLLKK